MNQLIRSGSIRRNEATQRPDFSDVANQRACINVPDDRNFVAIQIEMCGLGGAPIRGDVRKFAHNQRFDVRLCGLFIIEVRANVSNVGIR